MDKQQKILDHIVEAQNWYAEANARMQQAIDYLDELYFENVVDGELNDMAIHARRLKVLAEKILTENVKLIPGEMEWTIKNVSGRFFPWKSE